MTDCDWSPVHYANYNTVVQYVVVKETEEMYIKYMTYVHIHLVYVVNLGEGLILLPAITDGDSVVCDEVQVLLVSSPLWVEEGPVSHPVREKGKQLLSVSIPRDL